MPKPESRAIFVLDTSAVLAHLRVEQGYDAVAEILGTPGSKAFISAITWLELRVRLQILAPDMSVRAEILHLYRELLAGIEPVTVEIADLAMELRLAAGGRLPNADALIAATAKKKNAILVHRDPHFDALPPDGVDRLRL